MSENPKTSIIVNNYNYGRFLADAIDSALAQTYPNTEVIVVDDGSTDESRDVIRRYERQIIPVLKTNGGQASAFNAGFAVACGETVCFLDADDTLDATAISEVISAFHDPQIVKVEWLLEIMDESGRPIGSVIPEQPSPPDLRELTISTGPFYDWLSTPPSSGNCYSSRMIRRVLPIPEPAFRHGADVYLTMLAPFFGGIHRLTHALGRYRIHDSNNYYRRPLDEVRLHDYLERFENCCLQLASYLRMQHIPCEPDAWKKNNFNYLWPTRLLKAKSDIEAIVPRGGSFVLINNNEWGSPDLVDGRRAIPFSECNGEYWGPPADDQRAIAELIRLRREKQAAYVIFWWTAYWWLNEYPDFHTWLRSKHKCVLENDRVIVFDINEQAAKD